MKKILISGIIGNALEWYDYALYAQFAHIISSHFFPNSNIKEILTLAVFAAGFIVRPFGGVIFGYIGDRFGRKISLVVGILTMAIPTAGIGLLPGYETIGIAAPILLTIIRLIQGFSLGGEFSGCISYIVEHAPMKYRGLAGSAAAASICLGMLLGIATATLFHNYMDAATLNDWGWRIPFVAGLFIGFVGLYIRHNLSESPLYKAAKEAGLLSKAPVRETCTTYLRQVLIAIGIYITVTGPFYTLCIFTESLLKILNYTQIEIAIISASVLSLMMVILPISAALSDKYGRKPILLISSCVLLITAYPIFLAFQSQNFYIVLSSQLCFSALIGMYMGPVPTILVELFPTKVRFTGIALSYNISAAIFGGTAPMFGMLLYKHFNTPTAVAFYIMLLTLISLTALIFYKETYRNNLTLNI